MVLVTFFTSVTESLYFVTVCYFLFQKIVTKNSNILGQASSRYSSPRLKILLKTSVKWKDMTYVPSIQILKSLNLKKVTKINDLKVKVLTIFVSFSHTGNGNGIVTFFWKITLRKFMAVQWRVGYARSKVKFLQKGPKCLHHFFLKKVK